MGRFPVLNLTAWGPGYVKKEAENWRFLAPVTSQPPLAREAAPRRRRRHGGTAATPAASLLQNGLGAKKGP